MSTNKTIVGDFSYKKTLSSAGYSLDVDSFDGTEAIHVGNLPDAILITDVYVIVKTVGNSGLTFDIGTSDGGAQLMNDAVGTTAAVLQSANINLSQPLSVGVYVKPSATVTQGSFVVIINYIEYTLKLGTLTTVDYISS